MDLLANDLSIHQQFHDMTSFRDALVCLMTLRKVAQRFGREVYCHPKLLTAYPMPDVSMQQAIGSLAAESERRATMIWLTRTGPFWNDLRKHRVDDWLECRGEIVTDSAVGEAAFRVLNDVACALVSVIPSDWDYSPIKVTLRREAEGQDDRSTPLENWRNAELLEESLRGMAPPIRSWGDLREVSVTRFEGLTFASDCFEPLDGVPFAKSAAERLFAFLDVLDRLSHTFDETGKRTTEGQLLCQDHFMGDNAWFSDSSDSEKHKFSRELTFSHPHDSRKSLFCPWHGKTRQKTLRLHFSWPVQYGKPVYVVYAGPKITRR